MTPYEVDWGLPPKTPSPAELIDLLERCIQPITKEMVLQKKVFEKCNYCTYNGQRGCRNILTQKVIDIARGKKNGETH